MCRFHLQVSGLCCENLLKSCGNRRFRTFFAVLRWIFTVSQIETGRCIYGFESFSYASLCGVINRQILNCAGSFDGGFAKRISVLALHFLLDAPVFKAQCKLMLPQIPLLADEEVGYLSAGVNHYCWWWSQASKCGCVPRQLTSWWQR